ncbi:unnamed protein product [Pylaiella littoralis]
MTSNPLFEEVASRDVLGFSFGGRSYADQLTDAVAKTKVVCGVKVERKFIGNVSGDKTEVVYVQHNFGFLGGSLGQAEGEKITRAFEYGLEHRLPVVVQCRSGGARMQEGTMSLMQMAKVSVAVEALRRAGVPFVSVLADPTYGGVSASYAMQADVRVAVGSARIGFAGPAVILNTMFEMDQSKFDEACPENFQSSEYVKAHGQLDLIVEPGEGQDTQEAVEDRLQSIVSLLFSGDGEEPSAAGKVPSLDETPVPATKEDMEAALDYTLARKIDRYQAQDVMSRVLEDFVELCGDGKVSDDFCLKGGLARIGGVAVVVMGTVKGHTPGDMQAANYGMPSPAGYRTALRLFKLAERFGLPVVTLVDTCGAWPSFEAERDGQSEAIATNLTAMAGLKVPIVTVIMGEGGSGGALGVGMGNRVGMLSRAYFGVISPEGAASILGRYKDDAHKAEQFPKDCQALATAQQIYADQLKEIGVVDEVIWEPAQGETHEQFPIMAGRLRSFICESLSNLAALSGEELVAQRYERFRGLGSFDSLGPADRESTVAAASAASKPRSRPAKASTTPSKLITFLADQAIHGERSAHKGRAPPGMTTTTPPTIPDLSPESNGPGDAVETAKSVLDAKGPEAMAAWVRQKKGVMITDTTMRDAHQSLLATRVRTVDLVEGAKLASQLLGHAFSLEMWGGATFDVAYRFLNEDPWERLRKIRAAAPNICLQMLIRGSNAVGYTSYPDNVVTEFVRLAAKNGIDVFRVFDCFNDIEQMRVCIKAVRDAGKVAEVCVCYTSDLQTSSIFTVDYYKGVAKSAADAGAHMIGIKDMAGLLKPRSAPLLVEAIRSVTDLPIHFHTHATSSCSLATALEMARAGCDVIDFATASMADCTSQPSLNGFLASTGGSDMAPEGTGYLGLEPYDVYWSRVRDMYAPFENGMRSGTARVFDHQIPGEITQKHAHTNYSNLLVQCKSMGIWDKWEGVLDMYRDVNNLFGDIVKVTPSSKCVGDLALYLVTRGLKASDVTDPAKKGQVDFPDSVVGLLEGRLGFPHKGFPDEVTKAVLGDKKPLTTRPSAALPPADFAAVKAALQEGKCGQVLGEVTDELVVSSLLYPKVFDDYVSEVDKSSTLLTSLPTPVFWYGLVVGQEFSISPADPADLLLKGDASNGNGGGSAEGAATDVKIRLERVGPAKKGGMRTVSFTVGGAVQNVEVKDSVTGNDFDGPMADSGNAMEVGSPMPGVVEKVLVAAGASVSEGDVVAVVSAMKMEVQVKATSGGTVASLAVEEGGKVIEGALIVTLKE